ncbi:Uridine phosphorylase [Pseudonocardia sp. Ae406_Ps2]|uniref:nucleoside phosphorylase n=1 Tax=unclassified Pseudonocardia TaxID=2619320 RepID=UPI000963DD97|nr:MULTISPECIES: nucleoside phosphorylase [unclassified Pseudonocardia]OLL98789.1 Uridine phosphorylase [Pseudonocardia sp. Ae331_Ps2]OLM03472.1 Uridine phosphorylase [Pseudonocardia sp. Ae406_Ps2]OLM11643.1 Uridine phosphorylase [Pseudonocardia sp. Ae505_Ps2]OLM25030.1 Uridine phosphorylase [Pseudonocardia sp. Ae706_Ps2]OLM34741.1 Uridine phosphorylase [Pseudonocardia sp. Ae717_Ps2]
MDLPLHEDDLDAEGVIRASAITPHRPDMPSAAVLCWFPEVVADVGTRSAAVTVLRSELGRSPVWRTTGPGGTPVAVLHPGVGAPLAAMFLEHLAALGVRTVVGVGGAGALRHELTLGHAVVLGSALRDEGTSFHYQPPSRTIDADPDGVDAVARTLAGAGVPYVVGRCWTTDAVFRETPARVARRRDEGCAVVDMEASALVAAARRIGVGYGQVFLAADSLAGPEWEHRGWTDAREARAGLFGLALAAAEAWDTDRTAGPADRATGPEGSATGPEDSAAGPDVHPAGGAGTP